MLIELLCIAAIYAGAVAYARWVARHRGRSPKERRSYVLVADNHEAQIEWYLRALRRYSRRSGTDVQTTVWLRDSSDETGSIVRQMARLDEGIAWTASSGLSAAEAMSGTGSDGILEAAAGDGIGLQAEWAAARSAMGMLGEAGGLEDRTGTRAEGEWTDTRLESARPIWIELSKPEDVARLPI